MEKSKYKIKIEVLGKEWKQEGSTVESTLKKFDLGWQEIKGKGVLTISKGSKKHEHLMSAILLRRIFFNKIIRATWAKNLDNLLK